MMNLMNSRSKFEELKAGGHLPSPKGVALQVILLTQKDGVSNQQISHAIKADPVLSARVIKAANSRVIANSRPIVSIVDAVAVLGFSSVKNLVLGLSLMEFKPDAACQGFDYHNFWAHSLLTAITAKNLVQNNGLGSTEEVFILGLLGQIGTLALATARPQEFARILQEVETNKESELSSLERAEFGLDHNQLTQAMLADWGLPKIFHEIALYHENPLESDFAEGSRNWQLLNVMHIANLFAKVCLAQESQRRKMVPKLLLASTRQGVEIDMLTKIGDKSAIEWREWSDLCGFRAVVFPPFAGLLEAVPLAPGMIDSDEVIANGSASVFKLRILLVDDDRTILLLLTKILEKAGHTVATALHGLEGLDQISKFNPHLIITDWVMTEMDGIDFCKAIRQNAAWRNIYVLIMTAHAGVDKLVEAFDAGANDYINKPLSTKVLLARLRAGQRVVQLQEEMEFDHKQLHQFADELAANNKRLRKSEVCMRAILDNSPYMTWLKDTGGRYVKVNKTYSDYFHLKNVEQIIGKTDLDLWPKDIAAKHQAVDDEVVALRRQNRTEEAWFNGDQMYLVETFRTPVIDENGRVLGTTGFARDITQRKQIERDLRIAASAFETQEGMLVTDTNSKILRVNHAFTKITGFSAEEAVGQTPNILKSGRHEVGFYTEMWKSVSSTGVWEGEIWNRRKNGEIYPQHMILSAVKNADNTVSNYVASFTDITLEKAAADEIKNLAYYDSLTQLPNRRLLLDRLTQALASSTRNGHSCALLIIDLDNFKNLNDTLGHEIGDLLLQQVAERLQSCVREGDTVARLGGDEFVVMLEDLNEQPVEAAGQAEIVGSKIIATLNQPYRLASFDHRNTPSIGITLFNDNSVTIDVLMKQADIAMYQAKKSGRNGMRFFDPEMQKKINAHADLESELRKAIENNQFQLYYQIQVDADHRPKGAEALIRWIHPERGMISPADFIPIAEDTGLIINIGSWVLKTACAQIKSWQNNSNTRNLALSINVSAKQFQLKDFSDQVKAAIELYGIDAKLLKLELTEGMLLENINETISMMRALKEIGVRLSLDDFGTGYSCLQYLKKLPLDQLKIDQSFVRDIVNDSSDKAIVKTIIAMAHSLNLNVIAEGVETENQQLLLLNKGCSDYQGYLYGRPLPIIQFEASLANFSLQLCRLG
jgi:diguanylate cyclase (GGDEF)-like protein/PAS domain S-box-containing protein